MKIAKILPALILAVSSHGALALSSSAEEFHAARAMACVLAAQSLGYLSEEEYGERTHTVLDGFDDGERDQILAKALGYYDGLMFSIEQDEVMVKERLRDFAGSDSCQTGFRAVTVSL